MPFSDVEKNLQYIKTKDVRLYEAVKGLLDGLNTVAQQTNAATSGQPVAPPPVNGVSVTGANGHLTVSIHDSNTIYRGIGYFAEHADNPQFTNPQIVPMADARNVTIPVGNQTRYVRVYSSYPFSPPSQAVYHGGAQPIGVNGGGADSGPSFLPSQGSGTGIAGQGLQGPGQNQFRSPNGIPPVR